MKETKLTKLIFAGFVTFIVILLISCGYLHVFAENTSVTVINNSGYSSGFYTLKLLAPLNSETGLVSSFGVAQTVDISSDTVYYFRVVYRRISGGSAYYYNFKVYYNDILLSTNANSPTVIDFASSFTFTVSTSYTSDYSTSYYLTFVNIATPTPDPTPTPVPTPTPEPTFNPDQPSYTTFFNHLLNDGNNALNALYLSWTQANNKFYTGIFFIGLPIMIGIFGIVAAIFFGGDD